ncbi:DUF4007 family protein [Hymenobacter taeanensis]|uniref:DUF4007 family protein n=1 Tax=Hymenobacter taeanensis TaxID=2735321 RepID=A0A6M6BIH0_9BACT|nr:DUF4007 family protein [Hymenobacter taeanensis]QJX47820.1 DUF4007 family protein [Hymenobacter taeanensis]
MEKELPVKEEKVAISYHRGFGLNRIALSSVLRFFAEGKSRKQMEQELTLGPDQLTAAISYCERSGLVIREKITAFGEAVLEHDTSLSKQATQWAMHYFLASPSVASPNYWASLALNHLSFTRQFGQSDLANAILGFAKDASNWEPSERTVKAGATAFISTYSKEEGLGAIGILEDAGRSQYTVRQPRALSIGVFACLLADYWDRHWPDRDDVLLEDITRGELAQVLLLSENKVNDLLGALAAPDMALIKRQRKHLPYQIIRQAGLDAAALWQTHLYR